MSFCVTKIYIIPKKQQSNKKIKNFHRLPVIVVCDIDLTLLQAIEATKLQEGQEVDYYIGNKIDSLFLIRTH